MFKRKGLMIDSSRNSVKKPETVKRLIDLMSNMGYNTLMLYTEDTYEIKDRPHFGYLRGRYSADELKDLDEYASEKGIELIPCIQTLGHLNQITRWYPGMFDCESILFTDEEGTYLFIDEMLKSVSECFKTRTVHIGMDEAYMLGRGKHLDKHGYEERSSIMKRHLQRVSEIAEKYGLKPIFWGDMFDKEIEKGENGSDYLPQCITPVYWDYYSADKQHYDHKMSGYKHFAPDFWFAGGIWTWTGFAPHNDFAIRASESAIKSAEEVGVNNVFFTLWGDDGAECPLFSVLPSIYYVSRLMDGEHDAEKIKQGFFDMFGIKFDDFMLLDLPEINHTEQNRDRFVNPEKYMLYNDCFLGMFDSTVTSERNAVYARAESALSAFVENKDFGYLFKCLSALCGVLKIKNDIGIRTRAAYIKKDSAALKALISDYDTMLAAIEKFYLALREQWLTESKPFGFEVQDARLGGLIQRVKHCRSRLTDYLDEKIPSIPELEEEIIAAYGTDCDLCFNNYKLAATTSVM